MGLIRKNFGKITIESRRESFYIHFDDGESAEVEYANLEDLIDALVDLRDKDDRWKKWKEKGAER